MKLINSKYGIDVEFKENKTNVLVIEKPESMNEIINSLFLTVKGESEDFMLWDDSKQLRMEKCSDILIDYFNIDFNSKKIISALYSEMNQIFEDEDITKALINKSIVDALDIALLKIPYECINYNLDFEWKDLFKFYNVKIDSSYSTLEEKIIEYIKIIVNFCGTKLLVLINAHNYLSLDSIKNIYQMAFYEKLNLLLIESQEYSQGTDEEIMIIDKDNCIIMK